MREKHRNRVVGAMLVALALVLSACASGDDAVDTTTTVAVVDEPGTTIEIASFAFGESEILGEIYAQALEAGGYPVNHQVQVGPREVLKPALENGEVHFVPEYVGSGLEAGFGIEPSADAAATRELLIAAYQPAGVAVLDLAPAEDKNTFVVTKALADELGLSKVSDLSKVENFVLGGPPECP
ncbi:MAG: glycine/betaine ABC transporter substrate-binding protein, partial [Acidimicrobiia bacterium]|nr:glycine/betaine ABC transporter substrate-binding protein [Acidimicrobiia bacterium]